MWRPDKATESGTRRAWVKANAVSHANEQVVFTLSTAPSGEDGNVKAYPKQSTQTTWKRSVGGGNRTEPSLKISVY